MRIEIIILNIKPLERSVHMDDNKEQKTSTTKLTLGASKLKLGSVKEGQVAKKLSRGGSAKDVQVEVKRKKRRSSRVENEVIVEDEVDASGLTKSERDARLALLKKASEEEKKRSEIEDQKRAQEEEKERSRLLKEQQEKEEAEEKARLEKEALEKKKRDEEEAAKLDPKTLDDVDDEDSSEFSGDSSDKSDKVVNPISAKKKAKRNLSAEQKEKERPAKNSYKEDSKRRSNKLTIVQALSGAEEERVRSLASVRRARAKAKRNNEEPAKEKEKMVRDVIIPEVITVQELANRMAERVVDVTKNLMKMGMMVTANQTIDADTAELVVEEFGHKVRRVTDADVEDVLNEIHNDDSSDNQQSRAPVVTFMGHVDHGKTSLLDAIRQAKVADGEAGGITQHIGAYQVLVKDDQKITFLDTPGHEAFTAMRKRGANATDVVVLVVAADDGIMAQTVEAINHAKAAEVPIIVAINKIDKPDANPQNVRNELLTHELVTEELGGDILAIEVSAKAGTNLDKLLDAILLQAEILELKANPDAVASGTIVESRVDKNKGVVSTLLVQKGTLKISDIAIAGEAFGKIRAMKDALGKTLKEAGPSTPVEVLGLDEAPEAGVLFHVVETEKQAREIQEYRKKRNRDLRTTIKKHASLDDMFLQSKDGGKKELPIVIKGDVQGSVEAIIGSLEKLSTDEVSVKALHTAAGGITSSDVALAGASNAMVFGFNVRADNAAKELATKDGVEIRYYSIIYDLIDDVKALLSGMLAPTIREKYLGSAEIRDVFNISKSGKVAGCFVTDGMILRGAGVRLLRDNVVIHEGKLKTLKRFKDDVKEVKNNFECGMAFENYEDIKEGDTIEAFELIEEKEKLVNFLGC